MTQKTPGSIWPNWQDGRAYDFSTHLTNCGWAWEFLRRNPAFQKDLATTLHSVVFSRSRLADVICLSADAGDLSRWGLSFCKLDRK